MVNLMPHVPFLKCIEQLSSTPVHRAISSCSLQRQKLWFNVMAFDDRVSMLFHGTAPQNVHSICSGNFKLELCKRFLYGRGIYFSRDPTVCRSYGADLILCKVLMGNQQPQGMSVPAQGKPQFQPQVSATSLQAYL